MLVVLLSAKGSPGVTTTALALTMAANAPAHEDAWGPALLVEADSAGGDLECWCGPHGEPGLLRAVTGDRSNGHVDHWRDPSVAVEVVSGVPAVLAPTTEVAATAALRSASGWLAQSLGAVPGTVVVDIGRFAPSGLDPAGGLIKAASMILIVCRPSLASVEHVRGLLLALGKGRRGVGVVLVGGPHPYRPMEVAQALGVPVVGVMSWDARGVGLLVERGASRGWFRTRMAAEAGSVLDSVRVVGDVTGAAARG